MNTNESTGVDEYVAGRPPDVRQILEKIRAIVKEIAPEATEKISYQMPAFFLHGSLIYYAAWKHHIGIYPPIPPGAPFKADVAQYEGPKGNLQLPLDKPIPYALIRKIVKYNVQANLARAKSTVKRG